MKLKVNKWNVSFEDENRQASYYGYKTKKEAQQFVDTWNASHSRKVKVIKVEE